MVMAVVIVSLWQSMLRMSTRTAHQCSQKVKALLELFSENSETGANIGDAVTATDPDAKDTLTYTLGGIDAAAFAIDSATGQLKTKAAFGL